MPLSKDLILPSGDSFALYQYINTFIIELFHNYDCYLATNISIQEGMNKNWYSKTEELLHPVFSKKLLGVVTTWLVWSVEHLDIWITAGRYEYNSRD